MLPISDGVDLTSMRRVFNGAYMKDNEEVLLKMKMCSREQM